MDRFVGCPGWSHSVRSSHTIGRFHRAIGGLAGAGQHQLEIAIATIEMRRIQTVVEHRALHTCETAPALFHQI